MNTKLMVHWEPIIGLVMGYDQEEFPLVYWSISLIFVTWKGYIKLSDDV